MLSLRLFFFTLFAASCFVTEVAAEDFHLPVLVGQTGASATFGRNETDAYTLAVEEWNAQGGVLGRKIVLDIEDTQTSNRQIVTAFHRFALGKPPVILGPTWLDGFPAVIPIAKKNNILLVTPSAAIETFTEEDRAWPVTFYHNSTQEIQVLLEGLKKRGHSNIALIYEQEPFAEMIRKLVRDQYPNLVADIGVQAGESDFRSLLLRLKAKKADALLIFVWDERSLLSLLQQLRTLLPETRLATVHDGAGWLNNPSFKKVLPQLTYSQFIIADNSFEARFTSRFGYPPILTASNAYDALNSVLRAIAAGSNTSEAIREYLVKSELDTITFGKFRFSSDGSVPSKVEVIDFTLTQGN